MQYFFGSEDVMEFIKNTIFESGGVRLTEQINLGIFSPREAHTVVKKFLGQP